MDNGARVYDEEMSLYASMYLCPSLLDFLDDLNDILRFDYEYIM